MTHQASAPVGAALAAAVLGPALQLQQARLWEAWAYGLLLAPALVLALRLTVLARPAGPRASRAGAPALVAAIACAGFALAGLRAAQFAAHALPPVLEGHDVSVTGVIASLPRQGEFGWHFLFDVESADPDVPPRLQLAWYDGRFDQQGTSEVRTMPVLRAGDRWHWVLRLKAPHGSLNPHGHDQELAWWSRGIQATGYVRNEGQARRLGASPAYALERLRQSARDAVFARVPEPVPAGVLAALAMGDQQAVDRAEWDLFRATGVAHLMSISGLHVTLFAWAAAAVVGASWRRSPALCLRLAAPHAAWLGGLLLAAAYAAFSGGGVPSQRTVWMLAVVGALRACGLRWPWPQAWLAVAAVVVTLDPWALGQAGFWLSFVAVGVLFATDRGQPAAPGWRGRLGALLREQAIVTVGLAPLTLLLFGQVSVVGLLANLLAIPWVTLVVTPLALGGLLVPPLWQAGAWSVQALLAVLQALAALPGAVFTVAAAPGWLVAAALLGGLLLVLRLPPWLRALGLPLLLPVLLWSAPRPPVGEFELLAADIGQGNAVLVRTARHALLYDAGPRWGSDADAGERVLVPLLSSLGERLDTLVVSHRDSDHSGGAPSVLAAQPEAGLLASVEPGHPLMALRPWQRCVAGQRWAWDGVAFEVLHPSLDDLRQRLKPNAMSCVLRITGRGGAALLAGDLEAPQERRLVDAGAALSADLLLAPHHGSRTSSSEAFLAAVGPRLALVQAGYRNRYGHPAPLVMERYARRGIEVVASPACGAARWTSQRPGQALCERQEARRYWHHQP